MQTPWQAPSSLEVALLDSLNGDIKKKSSWVLCWEQPVLYALLAPFLPNPELQVALPGILFVLGQFRLSEGDRGRWKSLVYRLVAHKSGRNRGR